MDEEKSKVLYRTRLAATEELRIFQSTLQLLQHLAQAPKARGKASRAACNDMVKRQIKLYSHLDNPGVIGSEGIRLRSVFLQDQSAALPNRNYYLRAVETRFDLKCHPERSSCVLSTP